MRRSVFFFANTDWYLLNFRKELLEETADVLNCQAIAFAPKGEHIPALQALGFKTIPAWIDQHGINPIRDFRLFLQTLFVLLVNRPMLAHLFTIKCVLYGGVAARLLGIPRVCAVTGLGHLFVSNTRKNRIIRALITPFFKFAMGGSGCRVLFQNTEDRDTYVRMGFVDLRRTTVIRGSGVNLGYFQKLPLPDNPLPVFLYVGRLIGEKGIRELIEAIRMLREKRFEFEFRFAGDVYLGNPSSLSHAEVIALHEPPYLTFLGHVKDIREEIARADVVVLPSYREGTPKSLLEAAACGRAILCSDIAGNEGVVVPDVNGYMFPVGDVDTLAEAMEMMIASPATIERYANASRGVVEKEFSTDAVLSKTLSVYRELLNMPSLTPPSADPLPEPVETKRSEVELV